MSVGLKISPSNTLIGECFFLLKNPTFLYGRFKLRSGLGKAVIRRIIRLDRTPKKDRVRSSFEEKSVKGSGKRNRIKNEKTDKMTGNSFLHFGRKLF